MFVPVCDGSFLHESAREKGLSSIDAGAVLKSICRSRISMWMMKVEYGLLTDRKMSILKKWWKSKKTLTMGKLGY